MVAWPNIYRNVRLDDPISNCHKSLQHTLFRFDFSNRKDDLAKIKVGLTENPHMLTANRIFKEFRKISSAYCNLLATGGYRGKTGTEERERAKVNTRNRFRKSFHGPPHLLHEAVIQIGPPLRPSSPLGDPFNGLRLLSSHFSFLGLVPGFSPRAEDDFLGTGNYQFLGVPYQN